MGKKDKKKKKVSAKKEKYAKFRKDKPGTMDVSFPDLTEEQMRLIKEDENRIDKFWRYRKRAPRREVRERKLKSKR